MPSKGFNTVGPFAGAWGLQWLGAEQEASKIVSSMIRFFGFTGVINSFIYVGFFAFFTYKLLEARKLIIKKKNRETHVKEDLNGIEDNKYIYFDELSPDVQTRWEQMTWITLSAFITGIITLGISTIINEGFYKPRTDSSDTLSLITVIFTLATAGLSLTVSIGYFIVLWPKTAKLKEGEEEEEGKTQASRLEDQKLYDIISPTRSWGIVLSSMYAYGLLSIILSEFDEDEACKTRENQMFLGV